ncbi:MAG: hypothetical protein M1596_02690, partial [Firmicutes bacterium]|nr:hypothetical protein [Bacillota bacterium]
GGGTNDCPHQRSRMWERGEIGCGRAFLPSRAVPWLEAARLARPDERKPCLTQEKQKGFEVNASP